MRKPAVPCYIIIIMGMIAIKLIHIAWGMSMHGIELEKRMSCRGIWLEDVGNLHPQLYIYSIYSQGRKFDHD